MAKIFKKIKNLIEKKPTETEVGLTDSIDLNIKEDSSAPKVATEGQRQRREAFMATISKGHELPEEYQGITKDSAKEQIRSHIQNRIQGIDSYSDEIEKIAQEREKARQEMAKRRTERRRRREQSKNEKAEEQAVITENAIFAKFEEPKTKDIPSPDIELEIPRDTVQLNVLKQKLEELDTQIQQEEKQGQEAIPLDGQISFKDLGKKDEKVAAEATVNTERKPEYFIDKVIDTVLKAVAILKLYLITKPVAFIKKTYENINETIKTKYPDKFRKIVVRRKQRMELLNIRRKAFNKKVGTFLHNLIEKERRFSDKMAHFITRVDHKQDQNAEKAEKAIKEGVVKAHRWRHWLDLHKRGVLMSFATSVAAAIVIVAGINWMTAYEYAYNGKTLGVVKNQEDVLAILDVVSEQLSKEHNAEVYINKDEDIKFTKVWNFFDEVDSKEEVLRCLTYMKDMSVIGYAINVEGKNIAILESKTAAWEILDEVKMAYMPANSMTQYEEVDFAETIKIVPVETKLGKLYSHNDALYKILTGAEERKTHIVQPGETFSKIAANYGISQSDLQVSNPTVLPNRLSIGQEILLTKAIPLLTVQTVEISKYVEYIPFLTTYEDSNALYKNDTSTKVAGQLGERTVTSKVVRNNGVEVAKLELDSAITKQPVNAVIIRGTKPLPAMKGTGKFKYPVSGFRLTSKFGPRWGRMHNGIDLACPSGTPIRASDGGTVKFAGYSGSYGYVVKIDHGGGYTTVYAHCSKLFVKVGQSVYQGQHIANVGSTGRSTGAHCHFEVQYFGTPKNPLKYL